jgi:hypothetical protein
MICRQGVATKYNNEGSDCYYPVQMFRSMQAAAASLYIHDEHMMWICMDAAGHDCKRGLDRPRKEENRSRPSKQADRLIHMQGTT